MTDKDKDIWCVLNEFRLKYFFSSPKAVIDIGDFDAMMDEVKRCLVSKRIDNSQ